MSVGSGFYANADGGPVKRKEPAEGRALWIPEDQRLTQKRQMMLAEAKSTELKSEISNP